MKDFTTHIKPLDHVIENIEDWPIFKITREDQKKEYLNTVVDKTRKDILKTHKSTDSLFHLLQSIRYQELIRLKKNPWQSDKPSELSFWKDAKQRLIAISSIDERELKRKETLLLLDEVMDLYANEIVANFKPKKYRQAKKLLPFIFSRLFSAFPGKLHKIFMPSKSIYEKMQLNGEIEKIRELSKIGTLVFVPTHFSNLDSPVVGFSLDGIGISPVTYGAGINLFTIKLLSNFMNNLGSYKVDRRRKNEVYLTILKNYSTIGLTKGVNSLFFPGGTRSRSGAIEKKIKKGLLSTAVEAQQMNIIESPDSYKKIFVVPVVLNYHFVMEANKLVNDYLKEKGKEEYLVEDEFKNSFKTLKFIYKSFSATPNMVISFGDPLDVFGNKVDKQGISYNPHGKKLDIKSYYTYHDEVKNDPQRNAIYTGILAEKIVTAFMKNNVFFSSHLVAFTAFEMIAKKTELSIFELIRLPVEELELNEVEFKVEIGKLRHQILELKKDKKLKIYPTLEESIDKIVKEGIQNLGTYHPKPIIKFKKGKILISDLKLLYYYRNRSMGYGLKLEEDEA